MAIFSDFVEKTRKHFFLAVFVAVLFGIIFALKCSIWVICFSRIVKLTRGVLSEQNDFFQTGNEPISVQHLPDADCFAIIRFLRIMQSDWSI